MSSDSRHEIIENQAVFHLPAKGASRNDEKILSTAII
jgi:hypothetical protein